MTTKQLRDWLFQNSQDDQWWMSLDAVTDECPVTVNEIEERLKSGDYGQALVLHVSHGEMANPTWIEVTIQAPELRRSLPVSAQRSLPNTPAIAAPMAATSASAAPITNKRILPAFILAFLLGAFGAHAFYAGQIFQGVIYLLMWVGFVVLGTVSSPFQGIPLLCVAVFALSDIIRIVVGVYKDGKGSKITQWT